MKIALIGYGKMGKTIEKIALERGHEIVSIIDVNNLDDINGDAFKSADVAIEFTAPHVAYDNCIKAMAAGVKVVSGSTGWYQQHEAEMREKCEKEGKTLFWSSNFSLGVAIFSAVNRYLAKIMNNFDNYKVQMEETHHIHKLDAPSGTALLLAREIQKIREKAFFSFGRQGQAKRMNDEIGIHAVRMGNVVGEHEVIVGTDTQTITLKHEAHSRFLFAEGAIAAADFIKDKSAGLYDMYSMIGAEN